MAKYNIYAIYSTCILVGTYEAETKEKAIEEAQGNAEHQISLCWECSRKVDELGLDDESFTAEEVDHE